MLRGHQDSPGLPSTITRFEGEQNSCQQQQQQQNNIVNNLYIWPAAPPQPQYTTLGHNFPEMNVLTKPSQAQDENLKASAAPSTRG